MIVRSVYVLVRRVCVRVRSVCVIVLTRISYQDELLWTGAPNMPTRHRVIKVCDNDKSVPNVK